MSLILGIDPGSNITGYALLEGGATPRLHEAGCVRLPRTDFAVRLGMIFERLSEIIRDYQHRKWQSRTCLYRATPRVHSNWGRRVVRRYAPARRQACQ